jgi:hypothetical protein
VHDGKLIIFDETGLEPELQGEWRVDVVDQAL